MYRTYAYHMFRTLPQCAVHVQLPAIWAKREIWGQQGWCLQLPAAAAAADFLPMHHFMTPGMLLLQGCAVSVL